MNYSKYSSEDHIHIEDFGLRLATLREQRKISARELSLSVGQNKNYIYTIEAGKSLPSMNGFLEICKHLNISPARFFSTAAPHYILYDDFYSLITKLPPEKIEHVRQIVEDMLECNCDDEHISYTYSSAAKKHDDYVAENSSPFSKKD